MAPGYGTASSRAESRPGHVAGRAPGLWHARRRERVPGDVRDPDGRRRGAARRLRRRGRHRAGRARWRAPVLRRWRRPHVGPDVHDGLAGRPRGRRRHVRRRRRRATSPTRWGPPSARPAPGPRRTGGRACGILDRARRRHQRRQHAASRPGWPGRSARTASRRSATSRSPPTSSATTPTPCATHDGFAQPMERLAPAEATSDVMRPYGVWAVISPFNYPMALVAGPMGAALAAGNTVVLKPSEIGSWCAHRCYELAVEAGVPDGVLNLVTGPGETVGAALVADDRVGRADVHRLERGRHVDPALVLDALAAAGDLRDGRQEPGRGHGVGRHRPRRRGHRPLGLQLRRPEVLSRLASVRRRVAGRRAVRPAGGAGGGDRPGGAARPGTASCRPLVDTAAVARYEAAVAEAAADRRGR